MDGGFVCGNVSGHLAHCHRGGLERAIEHGSLAVFLRVEHLSRATQFFLGR